VSDVGKGLRPHQFYRQALGRIAGIDSLIVLRYSPIESAARRSNIVAAIGAAQHVDVCTRLVFHWLMRLSTQSHCCPPFETAAARPPQGEVFFEFVGVTRRATPRPACR